MSSPLLRRDPASEGYCDVEMIDRFSRTEHLVEGDGGCVRRIGLNEDDIGPAFRRNALQLVDQAFRHAPASVTCSDGEVIDVDLLALPLELYEFVTCETADNFFARERCDRDELGSAQQIGEIGVAGNGVLVGGSIGEGLAEYAQQSLQALHVPAAQ